MILIVGCGFLGSYIAKHLLTQKNEKIIATLRSDKAENHFDGVEYIRCDVTSQNDLAALSARCGKEPLTVFYLAACHNVDYVFTEPEKAYSINITALKNFFTFFPNIRKFFFASTDCVYGDSKEKFRESSPLNPVNEYGKQKAEAEKIVLSEGFTVLRLPFMLGRTLTSKPHFYDNICSALSKGETVEMIDGMTRSVLSYRQAAEFICSLSCLSDYLPQIINVCSDSGLGKYEIGCILAKNLGADLTQIKRLSPIQGEKFFKDKRASCTVMDNSLLKSLLGIQKIQWEEIK